MEVTKQYQFKIYNRSADLENSDDRRDINGAWENDEEHTKFSATEAVKPWSDEQCSKLLDQKRKSIAILVESKAKADDLNPVRRGIIKHFKKKVGMFYM